MHCARFMFLMKWVGRNIEIVSETNGRCSWRNKWKLLKFGLKHFLFLEYVKLKKIYLSFNTSKQIRPTFKHPTFVKAQTVDTNFLQSRDTLAYIVMVTLKVWKKRLYATDIIYNYLKAINEITFLSTLFFSFFRLCCQYPTFDWFFPTSKTWSWSKSNLFYPIYHCSNPCVHNWIQTAVFAAQDASAENSSCHVPSKKD